MPLLIPSKNGIAREQTVTKLTRSLSSKMCERRNDTLATALGCWRNHGVLLILLVPQCYFNCP